MSVGPHYKINDVITTLAMCAEDPTLWLVEPRSGQKMCPLCIPRAVEKPGWLEHAMTQFPDLELRWVDVANSRCVDCGHGYYRALMAKAVIEYGR